MVVYNFIVAHPGQIFGLLFAISELLGMNPNIKSNSIFQLIYNFLASKKQSG